MSDKVDVTVTIRRDQKTWKHDNHINLSSFLREKIDEEMR